MPATGQLPQDAPPATSLATDGAGEPAKARPKKLHGRAFYESIGSPKFVIAPMVDQSEFAWRMLSRSFMPPSERSRILAYSPMLHARLFVESAKYRDTHFQPLREPASSPGAEPTPWLDGNPALDRPLFVQFCANDPDTLLSAARLVAPHCDAVDLNLGCPQGIARKGRYGAFLQEDQDLIYRLVNILHENLPVPVTAKIRILDTREAILAYARNVLSAGASVLAVHGRRREQKGHMTGLADWAAIRYLRDNLPPDTVIFANGNVLRRGDLQRCLAATGADAVMTAEAHLSDPALFAQPPPPASGADGRPREYWRPRGGRDCGGWRVDAVMRRYLDVLHRHALGADPPARTPLFVPGDPELPPAPPADGDDADADAARPRKRQKRATAAAAAAAADLAGPATPPQQSTNLTAVQAHLFHLLRHFVTRHTDVRDALARARAGDLAVFERILALVERRVAEGLVEYERAGGAAEEEEGEEEEWEENGGGVGEEDGVVGDDPESSARAVRECRRPWWVAQPIVRPLPKEAIAKGAVTLKKGKAKGGAAKAETGGAADGAASVPEAGRPAGGDAAGGKEEALERKTSFPQSELVSG